ncbi:MAG: polymerase III subunit delta protein [Parcubacteria group bacterium GW2011_GWA1_47_10]|uniref:Polymerase III subunit delta protein n=1 Tax=Candidatus Nomurabacteria bacterium GW2011_GWB1_47_6 TaxID=1618749 RepID=A0A0G1T1C7_9BACT|nr:MAG: polymerase III subunit delta protein [Parcubacteria group bacterium GW2011_GWA1_47_10]KKU75596.1 MAG: polymerase III subunit delta protein [Candidatus Nomurabacteria bacterium GW2011_GWB1_47_6]
MSVFKQLDKDNLHHAYLIEGAQEEVLPALLEFLEDAGVATRANSDFMHISVDAFKMEDARNLKAYEKEKSFSTDKKIFVISANSILLEAQNTLLKVFEEPIPNTHFFVIVPDTNSLIRTLVSRFFVIRQPALAEGRDKTAEKFLAMSGTQRLELIKGIIAEPEEEEKNVFSDSARAKALKFLNSLELVLHKKSGIGGFPIKSFEHFFKVREILRMPGSSVKNLLESVALITPVIQ